MTERLLAELDEHQRAAVVAEDGCIRVMAGAGTGKTRVLTTRGAWLVIGRGRDPRRIVATTFTKKAAREIEERLAKIGGAAVAGVRVGTLHSMAARLLRRHWREAGLAAPNFLIADDDEMRSLVMEAVIASGVAGPDGGDAEWRAQVRNYAKEAGNRIARWKENGLTEAMVRDPTRPRRGAADEDAALVYLAYQEGLARRGLLDFADLTLRAVMLLEGNEAIRQAESEAIEYMMVDEFQDTNRVQLRFVRLLTSHWGNLMVVGDDDQSVYSFRGASGDLMQCMGGDGVTDVALIINRRCTDQILAPANMLVDYNPRETQKVLRAGRDGDTVAVSGYPTDALEGEAIADRIQALLNTGVPAGEIAVLVRVSHAADAVVRALVKRGIRHVAQAGGFLERPEVRDVMAYLQLAINPSLDIAFERIIARPTRRLGAAALEGILGLSRAGLPIHDACLRFAEAPSVRADARASAVLMGQHLAALAAAARGGEASEDIVRFVLSDMGYTDWAMSQPEPPRSLRASFDALLDMARAKPDITDLVTDIALLTDVESEHDDAVHIGTVHSAKGLEWDHVFLPAFEEGVFPHARALEEGGGNPDDLWDTSGGGGLAEERRIAHVAFTRARHGVHVSFAAMRGVGTMRKPAKPSRFLREAELPVPKVSQSFAAVQSQRAAKGPVKKKRLSYL